MINKGISLVVPVYNEEDVIEETINLFIYRLEQICPDYEIIVINDGSQDNTSSIIEDISAKNKKVKVFHNEKNQGSGKSLWYGFQKAKKELVLSNFADRPFNIHDLEKIFKVINFDTIDFVVIVRTDRSANTIFRKITSYANYCLIRLLFGLKIHDFQFVQIYKRSILEDICITSKETFVPPELIIKLLKKGYRHQEVSAFFYKRKSGVSKYNHPMKILYSFFEIIRFWFNWFILRKNKLYEN